MHDINTFLPFWEGFSVTAIRPDGDDLLIDLIPQLTRLPTCSGCHQPSTTIHEYCQRSIRDLPILGRAVRLNVELRRVGCSTCGKRMVVKMLARGWSPQQVAARLKAFWPDRTERHVSHESIYLAIYAYPRGELKRQLIAYLRQGKGKRRPRSVSAARRERYPAEQNIRNRPEEVEGRRVPGHWESDLIMGAGNRSAVATIVERTSRFVILAKLDAPTADAALEAMTRELGRMAPSLLKTMTHDQGSEMARHAELSARTGMNIYFADPHSPWQRGSNENTNGLLRQYLPKGTDLSLVSQERLDEIAELLNTRPRQTLGWKFPVEVLVEYLQLQATNQLGSIH